jgi:hypothetical protein
VNSTEREQQAAERLVSWVKDLDERVAKLEGAAAVELKKPSAVEREAFAAAAGSAALVRTIADERRDYDLTPEAARALIRKLGHALATARCQNCGHTVGMEIEC